MATATDLRVSDVVRDAADRLGLTHAALAGVLGISRPALTQRLTGRTRWTVSELATLARLLDLDLHAILDTTSDGGDVSAA